MANKVKNREKDCSTPDTQSSATISAMNPPSPKERTNEKPRSRRSSSTTAALAKSPNAAAVAAAYVPLHRSAVDPPPSRSMGRVAGEEALRYSRDFDANSNLARRGGGRKRKITQLRWSDLEVGRLLGEGNFSHVYEVRLMTPQDLPDGDDTVATKATAATIENDVWQSAAAEFKNPEIDDDLDIWDLVSVASVSDSDEEEEDDDDEPSVAPTKPYKSDKTYALKHLHPQVTTKQKNFTASAIDLVLEAKILSCLDHPNIVKLFGVTEGSINKVFTGNGYFLLLDRLHDTLEDKIRQWITAEEEAAASTEASSSAISALPRSSQAARRGSSRAKSEQSADNEGAVLSEKERAKLLSERIGSVAIDIARGMEYLHKHRIVFRDLKPSNVGFTKSNRVKIFDFGLAREIIDSSKRLTGNTGSLRYMAPEVNRRQHYGLSVDVYSYGIMLWELSALQKPFKGMSVDQHKDLVIEQGFRPKISAVPGSNQLKELIKSCWSSKPEKRPTFSELRRSLADEVEANRRRQELEEIERQSKVAPKTGMLRMRMMRQGRSMVPTRRAVYARSAKEGTFENVPFS